MSDIEKAERLFREAKLPFPTIPEELAARLKENQDWLFSTREINVSPYDLEDYVREIDDPSVEDYVVLAHSGHGVNSYALQYYVVCGALRMFLHLAWGGAYMDAKEDGAKVRKCFSLADDIIRAEKDWEKEHSGERLTIVCSDFYGSYWSNVEEGRGAHESNAKHPTQVLNEVLRWLQGPKPGS